MVSFILIRFVLHLIYCHFSFRMSFPICSNGEMKEAALEKIADWGEGNTFAATVGDPLVQKCPDVLV